MKFCLGEIVATKNDFIKLADSALNQYDLIELWLDFVEDWDLNFVREVCAQYGERLILLTRRNDQKPAQLSAKDRAKILNLASQFPVLIDLDYQEQAADIKFLSTLSVWPKLLLSFHNYHSTPSYDDLQKLLTSMQQIPAEYYKIACYCQGPQDAVNLLRCKVEQQHLSKHQQVIVLGAGEEGRITRFAAYLQKQAIIYAPRKREGFIIPGQLTYSQYQLFEELLHGR